MNNNILIIIGTIVIVYFLLRNNKKTEKFDVVKKSVGLFVDVTNSLPDSLQNFIKNTAADVSNQLQNTSAPTQTST